MTDDRALELFQIYMSNYNEDNQDISEIKDNIEAMKRIIQINPNLTRDERAFLQYVYKTAISSPRDILNTLPKYLQQDLSPFVRERLLGFQDKIKREIIDICQDFIKLVENNLLVYASLPEERVFYKKLLGDYSRYMCEASNTEENQEKGNDYYKEALEIAQNDLQSTNYLYLGLVLNYTVFLYDVMKRRDEAIDLAQRRIDEVSFLIDELSEESKQNSNQILELIKENIKRWQNPDNQDE